MRLWASSDKGTRVSTAIGKICEWRRAYCTWSSFSQTWPLQHFLHVAHFATRRMLPVCEQPSHPTWHCAPAAMVQMSSHPVSFRHLCRYPGAPWLLVYLPRSRRGESSLCAKHGPELCPTVSCRTTTHAGQEDPPWRRRGSSEPRRLQNPSGDRRPRVWCCHRGGDHKRWLLLLLLLYYYYYLN